LAAGSGSLLVSRSANSADGAVTRCPDGKLPGARQPVTLVQAPMARPLAIGPVPVNGARHDAYAFAASGLKARLEHLTNKVADLGYVGVDDIEIVPFKRARDKELDDSQSEFNAMLSRIRSAVEHAVAKVKTWRMLSEDGGRYRCPLGKYENMLTAVTGLFFFAIMT
jgi:DDE superfamily endonuclease